MNDREPPQRRAWRTGEEWARLRDRMAVAETAPVPARRLFPVWAAAAAIVVAVGLPLAIRAWTRPAPQIQTASTTAGERRVVRLPDGSIVTLGPATTLRFTATGGRREATLDGMAAFVVVHDTHRPFVVRARDAVATDLGTEFTVRAYGSDSSVRVAVLAGAVGLANRDGDDATVTLRAGEVGVVHGHAAAAKSAARADADASWLQGGLAFDDEPLASVVAELARWFNANIVIDDSVLRGRRVSAVYHDPTLSGVLGALGTTAGFETVRSGRSIILRPRAR